jgi:multimeric flavodoxin WrbA
MRISIINGSARTKGATAALLKESQHYLSDRYQATVDYLDLASLDMQFCTGCLICYRTGRCQIETDEVEALAAKVKTADGLVIGTPTYSSNVSGRLKNFMDRGHFIVEQALRDKPGFTLVTYEIANGQAVANIVEQFLLVAGASRRGKLLVKLDFNTDPLADRRLKTKLHRRLDKFVAAVIEQRPKTAFERLFNDWLVVNMIWKPIFLKQPQKYGGVLKLWREKGVGHLDKVSEN